MAKNQSFLVATTLHFNDIYYLAASGFAFLTCVQPLLILFTIISTQDRMSLFRSAPMKYFSLHIPKEQAYQLISTLAEYSFVQFVDSTPHAFHRPYSSHLKRCEEASNKINMMTKMVIEAKITLPEVPQVDFVFENHRKYLKEKQMNAQALLDQIEADIDKEFQTVEKTFKQLSQLKTKINSLEDYKYLLFKARQVFNSRDTAMEQMSLMAVAGIMNSKDRHKFSRMIFRVSRGNSILYTFNIPEGEYGKIPQYLLWQTRVTRHQTVLHRLQALEQQGWFAYFQDKAPRDAFICVLQMGGTALTKINRVCDSFGVTIYNIPEGKDQMFEKIKEIEDAITDTKKLLAILEKAHQQSLNSLFATGQFDCPKLDAYRIILERDAIIFHTLNLMQEYGSFASGGLWVPQDKMGLLQKLVPSFVSLREVEDKEKPPTHFQVNAFTAPFQQIVNTYGIPRYGEVNPAVYAIPIFPFLFGVMFGDIGHGGLLLGFAIWLLMSEGSNKLFPNIYAIRYLLLMMGIFSFYSGWIYNEFFSIPLDMFGSCYQSVGVGEEARKAHGCVYPLGLDPIWIRASNELNYFNSYKMKFAVIIGVFQMSFAILLKMVNSRYFGNYLDLIFEWLPQQIFFFSTFGYMSLLIIYKWTIPWGIERDIASAPSIIGQMIALPLKLGSTEGKPLWDQQYQESLQYTLLMISLVCVPMMLIPKPLIIWLRTSSKYRPKHEAPHIDSDIISEEGSLSDKLLPNNQESASEPELADKEGHEEEHSIDEIAVHQIIETIEFVLGSISNTASYLRLWALSLAHGQLSKVFLEKTIGMGIEEANIILLVMGIFFFINMTLCVIMGMDLMECFLHALRLQWVEIQNKFFKADGWKFEPLSFAGGIQAKASASRELQ